MIFRSTVFILVPLFFPLGCGTFPDPGEAYEEEFLGGVAMMRDEKFSEANRTFRELILSYPDQPLNRYAELLQADCERKLGNVEKAVEIRSRVARLAGEDEVKILALAGAGMIEDSRENFAAAAIQFEKAANLDTDSHQRARHLYFLGHSLQRDGRFKRAREVYGQAIALAPGYIAKRCQLQLTYPDHFSVQTGAFLKPANARHQRELFIKKGYTAKVLTVETTRGPFHCVLVGNLNDRKSAHALAERIVKAKILPEKSSFVIRP